VLDPLLLFDIFPALVEGYRPRLGPNRSALHNKRHHRPSDSRLNYNMPQLTTGCGAIRIRSGCALQAVELHDFFPGVV
jgi:hypothetical protein